MTTIKHFPVGNGDMTLIKLKDKTSILVDNHLPSDDKETIKTLLIDSLEKNSEQIPFVDVLILTHPHQDHVGGFQELFHVGDPNEYNDKEKQKIIVNEIWVSPLVFKRASSNNPLVDDAKAFNTEARRRIDLYKKAGLGKEGNRIQIITEDEDGKTEAITGITHDQFSTISIFNEKAIDKCAAKILGPFPASKIEEEEEEQSKNNSSIIINFDLEGCKLLIGGDSEFAVWKLLWKESNKGKTIKSSDLEYDILLTPHHTSWHSLSADSISKCKEEDREPEIDSDACNALGQMRKNAYMVSSSDAIKDDDNDPPSYRAYNEYLAFKDSQGVKMKDIGHFRVTGKNEQTKEPAIICFETSPNGVRELEKKLVNDSTPKISIPDGGIRHG